ncbi:hypothetical protein D0865_00579 [Hortaea werneckii]|uniref:Uncharacterized protein n=1 Tax=Hortaea werneckii TaxID=91943 RepID=A0A3M7DD21_HORWE|nr:hypothetical protein KC330_g3560 [Hortaea werneckii]RMY62179.1 hypothetical protein D0865_00579 [Hortaea werneckii]
MASPSTMKRSPLTPSTITPPSLNRQNSYTAKQPDGSNTSYASISLANLRSRSMSPARSGLTASGSSPPRMTGTGGLSTPPLESTSPTRTSWEDCVHQREGYISFPDFDLQREQYVRRQ